ncbi:hypothetical protein BLA24_21235 [Streptomyces cinnamoneus]|uniref:Uncharacterized protein n=1 Tax=Streptomyces cinnamoneus TaxID=53446 RepID=A0A2G1XFV1_STRCJ|nr:helix-turn-helix transcriptional regulator [Streptomyces cinnamoneus]PHQ50113.1 hypothetical protein BLA24_21235 [Streptomyces cinnamoneus]PPT13106.1 XRE family transcriptional regulator [Streptomyces cinnamoneus]
MAEPGGPDPTQARDAAALVALMRELRERSGLTYRRLQQRAAEQGMALPRSTVSAVLARDAVPRAEVLKAFVVACGDGARLGAWLEARERAAAAGPVPDDAGRAAPRAGARSRLLWLPALAAVLGLACWGFAVAAHRAGGGERSRGASPAASATPGRAGGFSLFEGRSTKGATIASVGYRYWDTGDGWYGVEYVMPYSRDDREAYDDGWGGRLLMHYEDRHGRHTAVLADHPDRGQRAGRDAVHYGVKNVWFEVCDCDGDALRGCQRLRKART